MKQSIFKFVDRNQRSNLVLVPGWAFDRRIFDELTLPYNYFCCRNCKGDDFEAELKELLEQNAIEKISLLGWSQGAFAVCDFAGKNPDMVEEIILVSARERYEKKELENVKKNLIKNSRAYLYSFYRECFCPEEEKYYRRFKHTLLKDYLNLMSPEKLINDLNYLEKAQIQPESLKDISRVTIVHGQEDKIAPAEEARRIAESIEDARFVLFEQTGHLPFLREDFEKRLYGH